MIFLLLVITYIACVVVNWGMMYPDLTASMVDRTDKHEIRREYGMSLLFALFFAIFGPIGVLLTLCVTGFASNGFRLKP